MFDINKNTYVISFCSSRQYLELVPSSFSSLPVSLLRYKVECLINGEEVSFVALKYDGTCGVNKGRTSMYDIEV